MTALKSSITNGRALMMRPVQSIFFETGVRVVVCMSVFSTGFEPKVRRFA